MSDLFEKSEKLSEYIKNNNKPMDFNQNGANKKKTRFNKELPSTDFSTEKELVIVVDNSNIDLNEKPKTIPKKANFNKSFKITPTIPNTKGCETTTDIGKDKFLKPSKEFLGKKIKNFSFENSINKNSQSNMKGYPLFQKINCVRKKEALSQSDNKIGNKQTNANNLCDNNNSRDSLNYNLNYIKININETELLHQTIEYKNSTSIYCYQDIMKRKRMLNDLYFIK